MDVRAIELRHLRYFLAVAETAHFTRAAGKLHITQPTLSHQIRELEHQVALPLFDRVGRRVKLTAAGEVLLPHARRVLRELEEAQAALSELNALKQGSLKVGIIQTVNSCVIPEIVARYSAAYPGIRITCAELSVDEIESGLEAGTIDMGIGFLPTCRATLDGEELFSEELVAVLSASHPWAGRRSVDVRELAGTPLILLSPQYCTRQIAERAFEKARIRPRVQVEMNSVEEIIATVRRGTLISLLPALALCQRDDGVVGVPLTKPTPRRAIGLLWRRGASRRTSASAFAAITGKILAERGLGTARIPNLARGT